MRCLSSTALFVLATPTVLAAQVSEPLSVNEVIARHHELDGRTVEVRGWLRYCQPLSCILSASPDDGDDSYLSIGSSRRFDRRAIPLIGSQITVRARLDANCLHGRGDSQSEEPVIVLCTDRASELRNPILVERRL